MMGMRSTQQLLLLLVVVVVVAACVSVRAVSAERLDFHSFEPAFTETDNAGNRIVSRHWRSGGVATVNQHFVRLTPDRQSKRGALWSRKSLGVPSFSTVLKFRISGQGKNFFGDGIGFWIMQQGYYVEGDLHGSVEQFTGVGVIFDTFKNTESLSSHRDVTVLVNDGSKMLEDMTSGASLQGCDANVRYHAERADFSVTDASRAKIVVDDRKLSVLVDAQNTGEWLDCVTVDLPFPEGWAKRAHIGVTASTGQLADNHDVLSIITYSDVERMDQDEAEARSAKKFAPAQEDSIDSRLLRIETAINEMMENHEFLQHHLEHELASVDDHIRNVLGKLETREDNSEGRIDNLEKQVLSNVEGTIETRVRRLEQDMHKTMTKRIGRLEDSFENKLGETVSKSLQNAGGWKLPFIFIIVLLCAGAAGLYVGYLKLIKKHVL